MASHAAIHFDLEETFPDISRPGIRLEPLTPYRTAIFLLIRCIAERNSEKSFTSAQRHESVMFLHQLISMQELTFVQLKHLLECRMDFCSAASEQFFKEVARHRQDEEITIKVGDLLNKGQTDPFLTGQSVLGVFVRKVALARMGQSFTQLHSTHKEWLHWSQAEETSPKLTSPNDVHVPVRDRCPLSDKTYLLPSRC